MINIDTNLTQLETVETELKREIYELYKLQGSKHD
jgi:hypothetical protein